MTNFKLGMLYELKGQLGARCLSVDHDLRSLAQLADKVETSFYKGYVIGQMDMLKRFQPDFYRYLDHLAKSIKELENARE